MEVSVVKMIVIMQDNCNEKNNLYDNEDKGDYTEDNESDEAETKKQE